MKSGFLLKVLFSFATLFGFFVANIYGQDKGTCAIPYATLNSTYTTFAAADVAYTTQAQSWSPAATGTVYTYAKVNSGASGKIGFDLSHKSQASCVTNTNREIRLFLASSGACNWASGIVASATNVNTSTWSNPEFYGLTPFTDYIAVVMTVIPSSGSCNVTDQFLTYYQIPPTYTCGTVGFGYNSTSPPNPSSCSDNTNYSLKANMISTAGQYIAPGFTIGDDNGNLTYSKIEVEEGAGTGFVDVLGNKILTYCVPSFQYSVKLTGSGTGTVRFTDHATGAILYSGAFSSGSTIVLAPNTIKGTATFSGPGVSNTKINNGSAYIGSGYGVFNPSVAGPGTFTITYHWDNGQGCSGTDTKQITVNQTAVPTALADFQECTNTPLNLTATGTALKWYSDRTKTTQIGTASPCTPAPSSGSNIGDKKIFYVSSTVGGCESKLDSVVVTSKSCVHCPVSTNFIALDWSLPNPFPAFATTFPCNAAPQTIYKAMEAKTFDSAGYIQATPGFLMNLITNANSPTNTSVKVTVNGVDYSYYGPSASAPGAPVIVWGPLFGSPSSEDIYEPYLLAGANVTITICDTRATAQSLPYTIYDNTTGLLIASGTATPSNGNCVVLNFKLASPTFVWKMDGSATGITDNLNGSATFSPSTLTPGNHAISFSYDNGTGCTLTANENITITQPAGPAVMANFSECANTPLSLTATGTNLKWYSDAAHTTLIGTGSPCSPAPSSASTIGNTTTFYVSNTSSTTCESLLSSVVVTVKSCCVPPTAYNVTGTGGYCPNGNGVIVGLSGSQNGVNYQLKNASNANVGSAISGTGSAIDFGTQLAGTYTVVASNASDPTCSNTMTGSAVITISALPLANAGADATINCLQHQTGYNIGMQAVSGVTYSWTPSNDLADASASSTLANPGVSTTYTLTAQNTTTGCTASAKVAVTVDKSTPTASAGSNAIISCVQNTSGLNIGSASIPSTTYSWSSSPSGFSSSSSNPSVNPTITTTYTVAATYTTSGCTANNSVIITVDKNVPTADAGKDVTISCGQNVNGTAIGSGSVAGYTYLWSPATGLSFTNISNPIANPSSTTKYLLSVTDEASGCFKTDDITVTYNKVTPVLTVSNDQSIPCGSPLTLVGNDHSPIVGSWSPTDQNVISVNDSTITVTPYVTTQYTYSVGSGVPCAASKTVTVTVDTVLTSLFVSSKDSICSGDITTIAYIGNGTSMNLYNWDFDGGEVVTNGNTSTVKWLTAGTHTVSLTVTDANRNCYSPVTKVPINNKLCKVTVPNVFTPNGDGKNDYFYIVNLEFYPNTHCIIYNRWGGKVYESNDYKNDWDGKNVTAGTYYYVLEFAGKRLDPKYGALTVLKEGK